MSDVVVTGASGFIGKAVCLELLKRGIDVHPVCRSKASGIPQLTYSRVVSYDKFRGPDNAICIHLAGENTIKKVAPDPLRVLEETLTLARQILRHDFVKIVFASSAAVYGDNVKVSRREKESVRTSTFYGEIKLAAEQIFIGEGHAVARLANVYGPGMSKENVVSDILSQIPGKGDIGVEDIVPVRDYIHVTDVARGLAELALGENTTGIFNLGTGIGTSVGKLALCIAKLAGEEGRKVVSHLESQSDSNLVVDPTKMIETFGWQAEISLIEGMKGLVQNRV